MEAGIPRKITSFLTVQIAQHIVITISMKKGRWSWTLKASNRCGEDCPDGISR